MRFTSLRSTAFAVASLAVAVFAALPAHAQFDHLKCYKVSDQKLFKKAYAEISAIQSQFGVADDCEIKPKAKMFCVPASKTVTSIEEGVDAPFPAEDLAFDRACYKIKCPKTEIAPEEVSDQFGTRQVAKFKASLLCVPAVKGPPPGGTTTTTTTQPACIDQDLDGFGTNCPGGPDCDDSDATINPNGVEICDGKDNDCANGIDDGNPGGGAACNSGLPGVCAAGTTSCVNGQIVCSQNQQPTSEVCDGLDNDCDGSIDNGDPGGGAACDSGLPGVCAAGTTSCVAGQIVCAQNQQPTTEVCDGLDNNCDGSIDDGNPGGGAACNTGEPFCPIGTTVCVNGQLVCSLIPQSNPEVCDGLDNDCDRLVDEGLPGCISP